MISECGLGFVLLAVQSLLKVEDYQLADHVQRTSTTRALLTFGEMNADKGNGRREGPKGGNTHCTSHLEIFSR